MKNSYCLGIVSLLVTGSLVSGGCNQQVESKGEKTAAAKEAIEVTTVFPQTKELPRTVRVTGTLRGDEETTIAAKVSGRIIAVYKDFGDAAAKGEALLRVDPVDYELMRDERARAFAQALAKLGLKELPPRDFDVAQLPTVERARLQSENAKARYERGALLANRTPPSISQQDFADLRTAWDVAESNVRVERLTVEAGLAEARTLEAQLRIAAQRVEDSIHRTPSPQASADSAESPNETKYHVAQRFVSVGDFVQIGAPLFRLVDNDPVKLRASAPERRLGSIQVGQQASVAIEAFPKPFQATVSRVSPTVEVATRSFGIEILIPNPDNQLKPGSFASAEIQVGNERGLVLAQSSILTFAGVHKVVLVKDNRAEERRVSLGDKFGEQVEILSGVQETDRIVLKPSSALTTGTPVKVTNSVETK